MKEFKGTKGDWKVKHSLSKTSFNIIGTVIGGNYKIARIPYFQEDRYNEISKRNRDEALRNAKLIASAPKLLKALQDFVEAVKNEDIVMYDNLDHDGLSSTPNQIFTQAEKAINEALD